MGAKTDAFSSPIDRMGPGGYLRNDMADGIQEYLPTQRTARSRTIYTRR